MHTFYHILAFIRFEWRDLRRLARFWICLSFVVFFSGLTFAEDVISIVYYAFSDPQVAFLANIQFTFFYGVHSVLIFALLCSFVFLGCTIHNTDRNARISEVTHSKNISNFVLVLGKVIGIAIPLWCTYIILMLLVALSLSLLELLSIAYIDMPAWVQFILPGLIYVPTYLFCVGALIAFCAVWFQSNVWSVLLSVGGLFSITWLFGQLPGWLAQDVVPFMLFPASDLDPVTAGISTFGFHLAFVLLALGLISLTSLRLKRTDGQRSSIQLGTMTVFLLTGFTVLVGLVSSAYADNERRNDWLVAKQQMVEQASVSQFDLEKLSGEVSLTSATQLEASYSLQIKRTGSNPETPLTFRLNPGFTLGEIFANEISTQYSFDHGVVKVTLPASLSGTSELTVRFDCQGSIEENYGYLSTELGHHASGSTLSSLNPSLGNRFSILNDRTKALMPTSAFYPRFAPNPNTNAFTPVKDFFELDLTVQLPPNWRLAGGTPRSELEASQRTSFRYAPPLQIHAFALIADEYKSYQIDIQGKQFELLLNPKHTRIVEEIGHLESQLIEQAGEWLLEAKNLGFEFPYESFSIVEVPSTLRLYDTEFASASLQLMPGLFLLNERSFPTTSFRQAFSYRDADWDDTAFTQHQFELLKRFTLGDRSGGNINQALSRVLFTQQKHAEGSVSESLNHITQQLIQYILDLEDSVYDPRSTALDKTHFLPVRFSSLRGLWIALMLGPSTPSSERIRFGQSTTDWRVWDNAQTFALDELDQIQSSDQAWELVHFKTNMIARLLFENLGKSGTSKWLQKLLKSSDSATYTYEEFVDAAQTSSSDIKAILADHLFTAALPGFKISDAISYPLDGSDDTCEGYLTQFSVYNAEPYPGYIQAEYFDDPNSQVLATFSALLPASLLASANLGLQEPNKLPPTRIDALETKQFNIRTETPLSSVQLNPFFSLNRSTINLTVIQNANAHTQSCDESTPLVGPSKWQPLSDSDLVIDDLDEGFSVDKPTVQSNPVTRWFPGIALWLPGLGRTEPQVQDQGLPIAYSIPSINFWNRLETPNAFGEYRQTTAQIHMQENADSPPLNAYFKVKLPEEGQWQIDYHLPLAKFVRSNTQIKVIVMDGGTKGEAFTPGQQASYSFRLSYGDIHQPIEFDASDEQGGWKSLGTYQLPADWVTLQVSNVGEDSRATIFADAVRFRFVDPSD